MKRTLLIVALGLSACGSQEPDSAPSAPANDEAAPTGEAAPSMEAARVYRTTGEIRQIGDDGRVDIAHEDVEGYMPAMTMPFFGQPDQLQGLAVGDRVSFSFTVEGGRHLLVSITKQ